MIATPERRRLYAALHAATTKAGLDDEAYRAMLASRTGRTSAKELTDRQILGLLDHLNGFRRAANPLARKVHALWKAGAEAGWVNGGGKGGWCRLQVCDRIDNQLNINNL